MPSSVAPCQNKAAAKMPMTIAVMRGGRDALVSVDSVISRALDIRLGISVTQRVN